jgi:hypothetical protein
MLYSLMSILAHGYLFVVGSDVVRRIDPSVFNLPLT